MDVIFVCDISDKLLRRSLSVNINYWMILLVKLIDIIFVDFVGVYLVENDFYANWNTFSLVWFQFRCCLNKLTEFRLVFFYLAKDAQKLTTLADGEYLSLAAFAALLTSVNLATVLAVWVCVCVCVWFEIK